MEQVANTAFGNEARQGKSTWGYHRSGTISALFLGAVLAVLYCAVASHTLSMEALNLTLIVLRPLHLA